MYILNLLHDDARKKVSNNTYMSERNLTKAMGIIFEGPQILNYAHNVPSKLNTRWRNMSNFSRAHYFRIPLN